MSKKKNANDENKLNKNEIKLIYFTTNNQFYSSQHILTSYYSSALCSEIKNNNPTHIVYTRKIKDTSIRINFISIDLEDISTNEVYFIKSTKGGDNILIFVDQEKGGESIKLFKNILNFISNTCNVTNKKIRIVGVCTEEEKISDECGENQLTTLTEKYGLEHTYTDLQINKKGILVKLIDESTLEGVENHHNALNSSDEDIRSNAIVSPYDYYSEKMEIDNDDNSLSKCIIL